MLKIIDQEKAQNGLIKIDLVQHKNEQTNQQPIQMIISQKQQQLQKQKQTLFMSGKKHQYNQQYITTVIAKELCREMKDQKMLPILQNDLLQLQTLVNTNKKFNWDRVAQQLKMDRWALYRFWHETLERQVSGSIDQNDKEIIENEITSAIISNLKMNKQWQDSVKQKLSKEYHRTTFSITFNNLKHKVIKNLQKQPSLSKFAIERSTVYQQLQQMQQQQQQNFSLIQPDPQQTELILFDF